MYKTTHKRFTRWAATGVRDRVIVDPRKDRENPYVMIASSASCSPAVRRRIAPRPSRCSASVGMRSCSPTRLRHRHDPQPSGRSPHHRRHSAPFTEKKCNEASTEHSIDSATSLMNIGTPQALSTPGHSLRSTQTKLPSHRRHRLLLPLAQTNCQYTLAGDEPAHVLSPLQQRSMWLRSLSEVGRASAHLPGNPGRNDGFSSHGS